MVEYRIFKWSKDHPKDTGVDSYNNLNWYLHRDKHRSINIKRTIKIKIEVSSSISCSISDCHSYKFWNTNCNYLL